MEDDARAGPEGGAGNETRVDFGGEEDVGFVVAIADFERFEHGGEVQEGVVVGVGVHGGWEGAGEGKRGGESHVGRGGMGVRLGHGVRETGGLELVGGRRGLDAPSL